MGLDYTKPKAGAVYGSRLHKDSRGCIWVWTRQREPGLYMDLDYTKRAGAAYGSTQRQPSTTVSFSEELLDFHNPSNA